MRAGNSVCEPERDGALTEFLRDTPGYTDALAAAGYTCGISGKWHLGDTHHVQKSFSYWHVHSRAGGVRDTNRPLESRAFWAISGS